MDLTALGISKEELIDRIVEAAASQIVERERLDTKIRTEANEQVKAALGRLAEQEIGAVISKAMDLEFQPLTKWGEAAGPKLSIREMILIRATSWMTDRVDHKGDLDTGYNKDRSPTRAQWYVNKAVAEIVETNQAEAIKTIIAETKAQIKAAMDSALADVIAKRVKV